MSALDLRALLGALQAADVDTIVIGGVAVAAHGYARDRGPRCGARQRAGEPAPARAGVAGAGADLPTAGGRPFEVAQDGPALQRGANVTLDTRHGGLDIVQRVRGVPGYAALAERVVGTDLLGVPVQVCSLADLRAMKEARGSTQDRADLERLPQR